MPSLALDSQERLQREVGEEIRRRGRISLVDLAAHLNVDLFHVERAVNVLLQGVPSGGDTAEQLDVSECTALQGEQRQCSMACSHVTGAASKSDSQQFYETLP